MKKFKQFMMILIITIVAIAAFLYQTRVASAGQSPTVNYSAHVQNIGWQAYVSDGALAGTSGQSLRVESFRMNLSNLPVQGDISYATHIQNIGWQEARTSNQISGTTGQSLRMEAMRISLTGEVAKQYDVYYRTHVQNVGWMNWVKNGEDAGTTGRGLRMEAIEIKLVKKESTATEKPNVNYQAHVQNIGWQPYVSNGVLSGTSGLGLRVESFRMNLSNLPVPGDISYATHVQNIGWQAPRTSDQISGTTGQSLRMEAMRINLTGEIAKQYDIYYRTHIQNFGWLGWAKNGEDAGSEGNSLRMEAIEIQLVKKGETTTIQKTNAFVRKLATGEKIYAHRGASGECVEHTFQAYDLAIKQGAKNIELDLVTSKDGTLWVSHDLTAKAMTLVDKKYSDMTDKEISQLRITKLRTKDDIPILKLSDVFNRYSNRINYVIETKPKQNQDAKLVNMIKDLKLQRNVVYQTVQDNIAAFDLVKKEIPETQTMLLITEQDRLNRAVKFNNVDILGVYGKILNQNNVDLVHENGKKYNVWNLNTDEEIKRALLLGVDSYFTDYPARGISSEKSLIGA
ncbi:MAG: glycerophosphodiester phosphodiesterase family protein [Culicoidibacterales bacterium]